MPKRKSRKVRRKKNPRTKLIEKLDKVLFEILLYERGERCEICGGSQQLGLFHILPKGRFQRIRFNKQNVLIAGWYCCHYLWHHDFYIARDRIAPKIRELRGENYEIELRQIDLTAPPLTELYLKTLLKALEKERDALERGWQSGKCT